MTVTGIGSSSSLLVASLTSMRSQLDDLQRQLGTGNISTNYAGLGLNRGLVVGLRNHLSAISSTAFCVSAGAGVSKQLRLTILRVRHSSLCDFLAPAMWVTECSGPWERLYSITSRRPIVRCKFDLVRGGNQRYHRLSIVHCSSKTQPSFVFFKFGVSIQGQPSNWPSRHGRVEALIL